MAPASQLLPPRYFSVSTTTDGPVLGAHSMVAFGACVVGDSDDSFYAELQPISDRFDPAAVDAMARSGLQRERLVDHGDDPMRSMIKLKAWIDRICGPEYRPVFASFMPRDWSFTYWYCMRFLGADPFDATCLDVRSVLPRARPRRRPDDNALITALVQEGVFTAMSVKTLMP